MKAVEESARIAAIESSADGICWTFSPMVDIVVGIGYEADIRTAKNILYEIGRNDPARLPEEDVVVFVDNLGASSVDLGIRIWVKTADYWDTKWRLMENIKYALDENHISIPYQQIDVQIKQ